MNEQKFTTDQIAKYISGWIIAPPDEPACDAYINALHNAKAMLEDEQDGIAAYFERIERKPTNTQTPLGRMKREEIDPEILLMDGFDSCFVGIVERAGSPDIACYDYEKCIEKIMQDTGMDETDSQDYFQFNCACAWVGDRTPCFINPALLEE